MVLQWLMVLLIWLGLSHWLFSLEELLIGGWLTAGCIVLLPLGTALQLFGDPAASRHSLRSAWAKSRPGYSGIPQFGLGSMLGAMTACAGLVSAALFGGVGGAVAYMAVATFVVLAARRFLAIRKAALSPRPSLLIGGWYSLVACSVATIAFIEWYRG
jgi:hypothetical protein